jgi:hypothetical protein
VGYVYPHTRPDTTSGASSATPVVKADRVAQAVAATESVESFGFTFSMTVTAGSGQQFAMQGDGSVDLAHKLLEETVRVTAPAQAQSMTIVADLSSRFVEYLRSGMFDGHFPAGKSWIKVDVGKYAKKAGIDFAALNQGNNADPTKILDMLRRSGDPALVGEETVDGESTEHYRSTVDLRRLIAGATDPAARESLRRAEAVSGITSFPVDVWIDDRGYLRRVQLTETMTPPGTSRPVTMSITEDLSELGAGAAISVPSSASVVDVADLR